LHTRGHISSLKRTQVGKFSCKNANLLDDLLKVGQRISEFKDFHTSVSMLDDILAYEINDQKSLLSISQGKLIKIDLNKLINPFLSSTVGKNIFLTDRGKVLSFGKLDGDLFKPNKVLI
jgi:tRNA U55 pseudouridine synthase TruB